MGSPEGTPLEQALDRAGDGVCAIGPDGRIQAWNHAAEKILGYTAREAIGRACCDFLMGRDDSDNLVCYQTCQVRSLAALGESVHSFDMRTRLKGGQAVWINVSTLVVQNGRSGGTAFVHLFRDVTATKELLRLVHERLAGGPADGDPAASLTRRELEILRLIATGVTTREAAKRFNVSAATVRNHIQKVLVKLGVHNRLEAVAYANRRRLL